MSLDLQIRDALVEVATSINGINTLIGNLPSLTTTEKASLVGAINEVKAAVDAVAGAAINDSTTATDSVWSSTKVASEITTAVNDVINGAPGALDTLNELAVALQGNDSDIAGVLTALASRVRTDTATQGLNATQQGNARTNIGAASAADVGDTARDFSADFTGALA